jgi:hypothetical protein
VPDREAARQTLNRLWDVALNDEDAVVPPEIHALVNSDLVAVRFCLVTQLLGKLVDPSLDALCLQRGAGGAGQWDPRGFATQVIVPWNRNNQNVLGPSGDPYVSNPLRRPRVDDGLAQMGKREEWERLCRTLLDVETAQNSEITGAVFKDVLVAIRDRLREFSFSYVVPPRVSLRQAEDLVKTFMSEPSGGDRGLAVVAALFETFRDRLGLYREVRRGVINAADSATDSVGDLECLGSDGQIVLAVEVKERRIGDADVQIAIEKARAFSVRELLLCTEGLIDGEQAAIAQTFNRAWASGTNLYHATIIELMRGALPLLGEGGTRDFIVQIGSQLDRFSTQPKHRKVWKSLLDGL